MLLDQAIPLNHLALICLTGEGAGDLLHNYTTADLIAQTKQQLHITVCCNRQGQAIADLDIVQSEGRYMLILHKDAIEELAKHWAPFLPFAKAKLDLAPGWQGSYMRAAQVPADCLPQSGHYLLKNSQLWLRHNYMDNLVANWTKIDQTTDQTKRDGAIWERTEIIQSRARVTQATAKKFLPQALGYEELGGISYSKGCYLGQEIIARTHYRGTLKTHLLPLMCTSEAPAGSIIQNQQNKTIGTVINSTPDGLLLAVLRKELTANAHLQQNGALVTPYSLVC